YVEMLKPALFLLYESKMCRKLLCTFAASALIVASDATAGIVGLLAEKIQHPMKPSHQSFVLGMATLSLLGLSHVTTVFSTCCRRPHRAAAKLFLVLTWIVFLVGGVSLVIGALWNRNMSPSEAFLRWHFLSRGGYACFVHGGLAVVHVITATATSPVTRIE
ncbi:hypothetical protein M569_16271, partial [Genlisea aurea]